MKNEIGFTLVELMITLALAAIVLSLVAPSFSLTIQNNRLITQTNDFVTAINVARSEAVKRSTRVTLCKSNDGASCNVGGGWEQGWITFVDSDNDAVADVGEEILRIGEALNGNTLRGTANVANYISYVGTGFSRQTGGGIQTGSIVLCDNRGYIDNARSIIITTTGRISSLSATDGNSGVASCTP